MKIAVVIVRVLLGLMFLFASVVVLFNLVPKPPMSGAVKTFQDGLDAARYFMPLLKITELICAISFLSGRFVALATVIIFPIVLNILLYHAFLGPQGLPVALALFAGVIFLAYAYRNHYSGLFIARRIV